MKNERGRAFKLATLELDKSHGEITDNQIEHDHSPEDGELRRLKSMRLEGIPLTLTPYETLPNPSSSISAAPSGMHAVLTDNFVSARETTDCNILTCCLHM